MYWIFGLFFWHDYESKCDRDEIYIRYFFFFLIWRCLVRRQKTFLIRRKRTWASFLSNIKKKLLLHVLSQILMMRSHDLQIFLREPRNGNVKLITEVWNPIHRVDTGKWSENCKSDVESDKNQTLATSINLRLVVTDSMTVLPVRNSRQQKNEMENTKCKIQNTKCISYHIPGPAAPSHTFYARNWTKTLKVFASSTIKHHLLFSWISWCLHLKVERKIQAM